MTELTRRNALIAGAWSVPAVVFAVGTPAAASSYKEITLEAQGPVSRVDVDGFTKMFILAHVGGSNTREATNVFVSYTASENSPYVKFLRWENSPESGLPFLGEVPTTPGDFILYPPSPMLFAAETLLYWQVTDVTKLPLTVKLTMIADGFDPIVVPIPIYPTR
jgi:hypothetical protein